MTNEALNRFGDLEGIGPNMAQHLWDIGMRTKMDIATRDPEEMYKKDCELRGGYLDRCVLYVYRCVHAVCKAETQNKTIEPALHKWWNWSDPRIEQRHLKLQS